MTVVAALFKASAPVMEALVGLTAGVMAYSIVKYGIRFTAIMRHGQAALQPDGTTLRPEHRVVRAEDEPGESASAPPGE